MRVVTCLLTEHNLWLVALAAVVCIAGSWIGLNLYAKAQSRKGVQLYGWSFLAAVAIGCSVWCTHFIAMLAYEVAAPVTFDPILTMGSLIIIIAGCGLSLALGTAYPATFPAWAVGGGVGASVVLMHYTGMAAYHVTGFVEWDWAYVTASVVISVVVAGYAFHLSRQRGRKHAHELAVGTLVLSVVGLHFTGMGAVSVIPLAGIENVNNTQVFQTLAVAIACAAMMIIGTGAASYLIDKDANEENLERLRQMALHDALTGLPNRAHFSQYLKSEIDRAKENETLLAVIDIDLDRFKEINDLRGHAAGDEALKIIGSRLANIASTGEFVSRVGGDEFSAVKRFERLDSLHDFAARIERELFRPLEIGDLQVATGGSIGIAIYPFDGEDGERLTLNADLAMYRAKEDVERSICFYEEKMDELARERSALAADLRHAIERGEFELHYQVQNDTASGAVAGHEVLLRWRHPVHGFVAPSKFIPIAEETGRIIEIGEWVLRTACKEAVLWPSPKKIAVNVSAVQLRSNDLAETVHAILLETGLPAERLELEITESAIVSNKIQALHVLRQLRALGVTIAIDDFGVGYSSLETLRAFPFDKIKLDRTFTHDIESDIQAVAIVRAVLALGKSLSIKILAEGVETGDQLSTLRVEGCDEVQGFYLGRPSRHPTFDDCAREPETARASPSIVA